MEKERLKQAMELFGVPEEFEEVAMYMVTEAEWEMILLMGKDVIPGSELVKRIEKNRLAINGAEFIRNSYSRAVLKKVPGDDEMGYQIADLYSRYPYYAQYEYYDYGHKVSAEMKRRLNEWDLKVYMSVYSDDVRSKMRGEETYVHNSDFLTLEEALAFVEKHQDSINLTVCNCKAMMYEHDRPSLVCMQFDDGPNTEKDRGHGEKLTLEEAKKKLVEFNKKGLMQNGEDFAICNCDGFCCYPLQMAKKVGSRGFYPKSNYTIHWNQDKCIHCGKCTRICNFGAFTKGEDKKISFHPDLCWGCTICAENCPAGAIELVKKNK